MAILLIQDGSRGTRSVPLTGSVVTVGRHSSNTIPLADERVSRFHLELRQSETGWLLTDLGSGNGTNVNGQPATTHRLAEGDIITLGDTVLRFVDDHAEATRFQSRIVRSLPDTAGPQLLANLGVLYEVAAAASQFQNLDALLNRILRLVLQAVGAERGGMLLVDTATGELMPRAAHPADFAFSRTIAHYVLRGREAVLASNAADDERFTGGESIARHGIHEVIAAPMRGRRDPVGVLVLDAASRGQPRLTAEHLQLAAAVAHLTALAIEEANAHQTLMNAERLAAIGQTIAGMSHHIRNVMHGLRFGTDLIRDGLQQDDRAICAQGFRLVEKNQARIEALIQNMLSYSKERQPQWQATDLAALATEAVETIRGRANEARVPIACTLPPGPVSASCDPEAILAALLNLLTNAIDAVEGLPDPKIALHLACTETDFLLRVEDNGPGVPVEQRETIFHPFVSTKGPRGTGLGLAVSRKTMREHGGDVIVTDSDLGGAAMILRLPRSAAQITTPAQFT